MNNRVRRRWYTTRYILATNEWEVCEVIVGDSTTLTSRIAGPFETEREAASAMLEYQRKEQPQDGE